MTSPEIKTQLLAVFSGDFRSSSVDALPTRSSSIHATFASKTASSPHAAGTPSPFEKVLLQHSGSAPGKPNKSCDASEKTKSATTSGAAFADSPTSVKPDAAAANIESNDGPGSIAGIFPDSGQISPANRGLNAFRWTSANGNDVTAGNPDERLISEVTPFQQFSNFISITDAAIADSGLTSVTAARQADSQQKLAATPEIRTSAQNVIPIFSFKTAGIAYADAIPPAMDLIATEIARQIGSDSNGGPIDVRIRLDQTDVGPVSLHLSIVNDVVSIRIIAETQTSMDALKRQLADLQQSLVNSGINFNLHQVTCEDGTGTQFNHGNQRRQGNTPGAVPSRVATLKLATPPVIQPQQRFDFVA